MAAAGKREKRRSRSSASRGNSPLLYAVGALLLIIILVVVLSVDFNPIGERVEEMPSSDHVAKGTNPGPYNSIPPTSGMHYEEHFTSEFFNENEYEFPEGFLVHNLEHGYVIFWYNCELLDEIGCAELKDQIQAVMTRVNMDKVIAYPWQKIDQPVVMTSWGRLLRFDEFDQQLAYRYARKYHNKAPEPSGD
jgi:hypothetical protein